MSETINFAPQKTTNELSESDRRTLGRILKESETLPTE